MLGQVGHGFLHDFRRSIVELFAGGFDRVETVDQQFDQIVFDSERLHRAVSSGRGDLFGQMLAQGVDRLSVDVLEGFGRLGEPIEMIDGIVLNPAKIAFEKEVGDGDNQNVAAWGHRQVEILSGGGIEIGVSRRGVEAYRWAVKDEASFVNQCKYRQTVDAPKGLSVSVSCTFKMQDHDAVRDVDAM